MTAAGALVQMPSHRRGAAPLNRDKHFQVQPCKPAWRVISETVCCGGYDIGQLKERRIHLLFVFRLWRCAEVQRIQRAGSWFKVTL